MRPAASLSGMSFGRISWRGAPPIHIYMHLYIYVDTRRHAHTHTHTQTHTHTHTDTHTHTHTHRHPRGLRRLSHQANPPRPCTAGMQTTVTSQRARTPARARAHALQRLQRLQGFLHRFANYVELSGDGGTKRCSPPRPDNSSEIPTQTPTKRRNNPTNATAPNRPADERPNNRTRASAARRWQSARACGRRPAAVGPRLASGLGISSTGGS